MFIREQLPRLKRLQVYTSSGIAVIVEDDFARDVERMQRLYALGRLHFPAGLLTIMKPTFRGFRKLRLFLRGFASWAKMTNRGNNMRRLGGGRRAG